MDNFEYSIQLNDRDWTEFYLASEECSLVQAALATAEEPLPTDLEEGEDRLIRVRVGPAPSTASCLPRSGATPHSHLLTEEVLSGSEEDETDLGSVSRFLCDNSQSTAAFPWPSAVQGSQPSHIVSETLGGWPKLSESAGDTEAFLAAEGRESETGDGLADSDRSLSEVDVDLQKEEFQALEISGPEVMEKPACSALINAGPSKGIGGQAGEHGSRPLRLTLEEPTNEISQAVSVDTQFPVPLGSQVVCGNPKTPKVMDINALPTSSSLPSGESEGAEPPETGSKHLQVSLKKEAPSFQEKPPQFQGLSVPSLGTLAPPDLPSAGPKEGELEGRSRAGENIADLKADGQRDQRENLGDNILKEEGRVDQEISSTGCRLNLQKVPEEPGAIRCPQPTTDSRCSEILDSHQETAVLKAETQTDCTKEPSHHLGLAGSFEGQSLSLGPGSHNSNFLDNNIPYCLASQSSLEGPSSEMTQPQNDDHFISGITQERAGRTQDRVAEERLASDVGQNLPEMYGPDMYEYFFTDMEGSRVGEAGGEKETGLDMPGSSDQLLAPFPGSQDSDSIGAAGNTMLISFPEVYEHFFNNGAQGRKSWKRLFLSMPASETRKAMRALKSLLGKPAHLLQRQPRCTGNQLMRGSHGEMVVFSPRLLEESPPRPENLKIAVMSPERPLPLALTHRDMCLGFMAFASWAVKTSNLEAPDAWKIVLLANFGTLSAIRYFRRQIVAEGEHGT